jgi:predicted ribonuclease YlaK
MTCWGVTARNEAQKVAIRALLNDKPYAFLTGPAGSGKSLVAQAVGLERTVERKDFDKLVYTRLQAQLGMEIGHLPGDINEKTYPFVRPFLDNLEAMSPESKQIVQYLMAGGDKARVFFDPIQTMRGGSFHRAYIIVDEAQNLDVATIHAVATRLATSSKMVFCGNFAQIDTPKLRKPETNGLYRLLSGLYERNAHDYFDHVNLTEVERHPAIAIVEDILRNHEMAQEFAELEARGNVG